MFQQFRSPEPRHVEAKYVFPLQRGCVVCGFEAYIGAKHVVGVVREKQKAREEYRKAVDAGHGAYLMEEEEEVWHWPCQGHPPPGICFKGGGYPPPLPTLILQLFPKACPRPQYHPQPPFQPPVTAPQPIFQCVPAAL